MFSDRVISALRRSLGELYKKDFKEHVKLSDDEVFEELKELIRPEEL
jgi:hypothetical protein